MLEIVEFMLCVLWMVKQSLSAHSLLFLILVRSEAGELWDPERISPREVLERSNSGSTSENMSQLLH